MHHLPTLMRFCNQNLPTIIMCAMWCNSSQNYLYHTVTSSLLVKSSQQHFVLGVKFHTHMNDTHTLSADVHESEPWAAFSDLSLPNRALILPGTSLRACSESVGPRSSRHFATPLSASNSIAITGPEVMYSTRKLKQANRVHKLQIQKYTIFGKQNTRYNSR